jgi:hypothetical protein
MNKITTNLRIAAALFCMFQAGQSRSEDERTATTVAKWDMTGTTPVLIINIGDLLTPAQRDIINSGFSTFTLLAISDKKLEDSDQLPESKLACSVKYDTWEERYQMIRVDPPPVQTMTAKDYKTWATECLRHKLTTSPMLSRLTNGGSLFATLQVRQSSADEGAKIKNWLVQQQSGFMQGLYAHMLGDFQFKGTIRIIIQVPAMSSARGDAPTKQDTVKKGI